MGQTMTEKILSRAAGRRVEPGEIAEVAVDLVMTNDITAPLAIKEFKKTGLEQVFDPNKVVFVPDHFVPAKDIKAAEQAKVMREFAVEQGAIYFEVGRAGIEHVVLPENGLTLPGQVIIGGDSHTCTYGAFNAFATGMGSTDIAAAMALGTTWVRVPPTIKFVYNGTLPEGVGGKDLILYTIGQIGVDGALYAVMEFTGEVIDALDMDGRIAMANMAIEAGAKTGIFACDDKTREWLARVTDRPYEPVESDPDAEYLKVIEFDVSNLKPVVALPHLPSNVYPADEVGDMPIHQVVIGPARTAGSATCARWRRSSRVARCTRTCAASSSRAARRWPSRPRARDWPTSSWRRARSSPPPPAARAWAATWVSWPRASAASRPPTATSAGVWDTGRPRSSWPVPRWRRPARCSAVWPRPPR